MRIGQSLMASAALVITLSANASAQTYRLQIDQHVVGTAARVTGGGFDEATAAVHNATSNSHYQSPTGHHFPNVQLYLTDQKAIAAFTAWNKDAHAQLKNVEIDYIDTAGKLVFVAQEMNCRVMSMGKSGAQTLVQLAQESSNTHTVN